MNCDPYALEQAAKCFNCLPDQQLLSVETYLECQWYNHLTPPTPISDYSIGIVGGWESGTFAPNSIFYYGGDFFNSTHAGLTDFTFGRILIPQSGTIKSWSIHVRITTPGSGENVQHALTDGVSDFGLVNLPWNADPTGAVIVLNQSVTAGQNLAVKITTPLWVSSPIGMRFWAIIYITA